jgi:hypothetical protein
MNTIDLSSIGVEELNSYELSSIEGGSKAFDAGKADGAAARQAFENASLLIAAVAWFMFG